MKGILSFISTFAVICLIGCILSLIGATPPIPFVSYVFWISLATLFISAQFSDK